MRNRDHLRTAVIDFLISTSGFLRVINGTMIQIVNCMIKLPDNLTNTFVQKEPMLWQKETSEIDQNFTLTLNHL